jgi:hypothetical protein
VWLRCPPPRGTPCSPGAGRGLSGLLAWPALRAGRARHAARPPAQAQPRGAAPLLRQARCRLAPERCRCERAALPGGRRGPSAARPRSGGSLGRARGGSGDWGNWLRTPRGREWRGSGGVTRGPEATPRESTNRAPPDSRAAVDSRLVALAAPISLRARAHSRRQQPSLGVRAAPGCLGCAEPERRRGVKEALHVKAQRGGPQALFKREANRMRCVWGERTRDTRRTRKAPRRTAPTSRSVCVCVWGGA